MTLTFLAWLSNPITCMLLMMLVAATSRILRRSFRDPQDDAHVVRVGSGGSEALAVALMFLTTAYRPSVESVAKAQIQEHEDADDDDQGGPDSPKKHFRRQLRSIRNGENLDRLVWRLE